MNVKQFKSFVRNISETKAPTSLLGRSSVSSMEKEGANVRLEDTGSDTSPEHSVYLVQTEQLLGISKKLKATKEEMSMTYTNGKLSLCVGLAIYDIPATEIVVKAGSSKSLVLTELSEGAEDLKQFLITSCSIPSKDEAEFLPIVNYVHVFCRPDDIFTIESMNSVEELRLDSVILTDKPIRGCFDKKGLAKLLKPLKNLGYASRASVYLKSNGAKGAKLCITFKTSEATCTLSLPLLRRTLDIPFLSRLTRKDEIVLMTEGNDDAIVEQLGTLGVEVPTKQAQAIAREFPDMVTAFAQGKYTVLSDSFLQHCFTSPKE